jgi:hypothetical protein
MDDLIKKIKEKKVILFVGAGVSATLNLPTWDQLMNFIAESLQIDKDIFKMYGDNLALAEYYTLVKGSIGPLRSWMDRNWNIDDEKIKDSKIYQNICKLDFPIIYTTNYDNCLERIYKIFSKDYNKISKVEDICDSENSKTQIVKFHGDFEDDNGIVLTESSYFNRMDFESPLDIKLRSDILGKSVLFIGYSLSDINIRYLIYKFNMLWQSSGNQYQRPKSYIFLTAPNPVQELIWERRQIIPIIGEGIDQTSSLDKFLQNIIEEVDKNK